MALPNVIIKLQNGGLGRVALTADGGAGLILSGMAVTGKLELNRAYPLSSARDLTALGVTAENNPLIQKEVAAFYAQAGDGAELYLLVVSEATTLTQMCAGDDASCRAAGLQIMPTAPTTSPPDWWHLRGPTPKGCSA